MIVGREKERGQIQRLLDEAQAGHGGALVLRGEPGIGKTTLVNVAVEAADGFQIVRARGVESERELPFAALDELLRPFAGLLEELPGPQCRALKAALALEESEGVDRFAVCAAALGLLAVGAEQQPVLCVIDDAHWLDRASAEALAFAARRVEHEAILILFATRETDSAFTPSGIPDLRLGGLGAEQARRLVAEHAWELVPAEVERLIALSGGNPLALIEFGLVLAQADHAGSLPAELPSVGDAVQRRFLERSSRLSRRTRRALLLVAASDPAEPDALWAALEAEGVADSIDEAEQGGLLVRRPQLDFAHPLARSAIYQSARPGERLPPTAHWPPRCVRRTGVHGTSQRPPRPRTRRLPPRSSGLLRMHAGARACRPKRRLWNGPRS